MKVFMLILCTGLALASPEKRPSGGFIPPPSIQHSSAGSGNGAVANNINQEGAYSGVGGSTFSGRGLQHQQIVHSQGSTSFARQSGLSARYIPVQQPQPIFRYSAPQPETRYVQPDAPIRYVIARPRTSYTAVAPAPRPRTRYSVIQPPAPIISRPRYAVSQPAPRPSYGSSRHLANEFGNDDAKYKFGYQIRDDYTANFQSRQEQRDGKRVAGSYAVNDPDGFLRTVRYGDDGHGFFATVTRQPNSLIGTSGSRGYGGGQGGDADQQQQHQYQQPRQQYQQPRQFQQPQQQFQLPQEQFQQPQLQYQQPQQQFVEPQQYQPLQVQQFQQPQQQFEQPQPQYQLPQEQNQQPQPQYQQPQQQLQQQQQFQEPQQQFIEPQQQPQQQYQLPQQQAQQQPRQAYQQPQQPAYGQ